MHGGAVSRRRALMENYFCTYSFSVVPWWFCVDSCLALMCLTDSDSLYFLFHFHMDFFSAFFLFCTFLNINNGLFFISIIFPLNFPLRAHTRHSILVVISPSLLFTSLRMEILSHHPHRTQHTCDVTGAPLSHFTLSLCCLLLISAKISQNYSPQNTRVCCKQIEFEIQMCMKKISRVVALTWIWW